MMEFQGICGLRAPCTVPSRRRTQVETELEVLGGTSARLQWPSQFDQKGHLDEHEAITVHEKIEFMSGVGSLSCASPQINADKPCDINSLSLYVVASTAEVLDSALLLGMYEGCGFANPSGLLLIEVVALCRQRRSDGSPVNWEALFLLYPRSELLQERSGSAALSRFVFFS